MKKNIKRNILLNPGPATTTDSVKYAQLVPDICPREKEFCDLVEWAVNELTNLVASSDKYTTILFGGSGTAAVEAMLSSVVEEGKLLVVNNGAYGKRMCRIAEVYGIDFIEFYSSSIEPLDIKKLESFSEGKNITHLAVVHNETTTGLLNNIQSFGDICARNNIDLLVDAVSSYAALPIDMQKMNIKFLAAVSNKNIQSMAGICLVIANLDALHKLEYIKPKNLYLNLYDQYDYFQKHRQMRFTPPVQVFYALKQAILELKEETVEGRYKRYSQSWQLLMEGLRKLNLKTLVPKKHHSRLITTVVEPTNPKYSFNIMHDFLYKHGYTIYPGKIDEHNTFRVANIGAIDHNDISGFLECLKEYLETL